MTASFSLTSTSDRSPLRVGLLVDGLKIRRSLAEVIEHICLSDFARIELVVVNDGRQADYDGQLRKGLFFRAYERWDRRHIGGALDPLAPVDCSARLHDVETLRVAAAGTRAGRTLPAAAVDHLRRKQLDVLVCFGFGDLRGEVLTSARHGLWSYRYGDGAHYRGGPPYFWEIVERNPLSGAALHLQTPERDDGLVLREGQFATAPGLSHARNGVQPYWGAAPFVIQALHDLHQFGWEHVQARIRPAAQYQGRKRTYTVPSNVEMVRWLAPAMLGKIASRLKPRPGIPLWRLGVRVGDRALVDEGPESRLAGFRWLDAPRGRFYADPFLLHDAGKTWLFFEDADLMTWRGVVSAAQVREDGSLDEPVTVLDRPYHLSYPHLIRDGRDLYMIPETRKHGTVELYRCERFPDRWHLVKELYRGSAVDTTVWVEDGRYWFFVTFVEPRGGAAQLWLFSATTLAGEWTPHPASPVSVDVRRNRGAGALFRDARGRLIRPSQNGSINYGRSFTLNEVLVLDPKRYEERPLVVAEPPGGFRGTHSYARTSRVEFVDGCALVPQRLAGGRPVEEAG